MIPHSILALTAGSLLCAASLAQNCNDNIYTAHLVTASGAELPTFYDPVVQSTSYQAPTEHVFLAFDPNIPSGTYYVHVTDNPVDGLDEVVSNNDPMDRFVAVTNTGGVITLSLPFSSNPGAQEYGVGHNGVGQSLRLYFGPSQYTQCRFKVWLGDNWDLSSGPGNPYLVRGGIHPSTGLCSIRSYTALRVGDGSGSDVLGHVFNDANGNGVRDAGEAGLANWQVRLVGGPSVLSTISDSDGKYHFDNVGAGNFTVELTVQPGWTGTTALAYTIETCACATLAGGDFGVQLQNFQCNARTIGYWRNNHGQALVTQFNILPTLPNLFIVNQAGQRVAFANIGQYKNWLQGANATNMAYMLSAQLVAMHNNVTVGFVHPDCVVHDPALGHVAIGQVMQQAVASLQAHPFTTSGSPHRAHQAALKDALDRANNNQTWH
jgi:hypothetical protein